MRCAHRARAPRLQHHGPHGRMQRVALERATVALARLILHLRNVQPPARACACAARLSSTPTAAAAATCIHARGAGSRGNIVRLPDSCGCWCKGMHMPRARDACLALAPPVPHRCSPPHHRVGTLVHWRHPVLDVGRAGETWDKPRGPVTHRSPEWRRRRGDARTSRFRPRHAQVSPCAVSCRRPACWAPRGCGESAAPLRKPSRALYTGSLHLGIGDTCKGDDQHSDRLSTMSW